MNNIQIKSEVSKLETIYIKLGCMLPIKIIKIFKVGSTRFFSEFKDFVSKDTDEICIIDGPLNEKENFNLSFNGKQDVFVYTKKTKEEFIDLVCNSKKQAVCGMFIVPEFNEWLGFTIDDLKKLDDLFSCVDNKHVYVKMIRDFYIQNDGFFLTKEQLEMAYEEYKQERSGL